MHPTASKRKEELAFLWAQPQDGACLRDLALHRVHLQAVGVFNPGIPQEVLCRDSSRQPRLWKTYAIDNQHKFKQIINTSRISILFRTYRLKTGGRQNWTLTDLTAEICIKEAV